MLGTNRGKSTFLELVFPPISNQEAYRFKDQPTADFMRKSDFYMIGGKTKSRFSILSACEKNMTITFDLYIGNDLRGNGAIEIPKLEAVKNFKGNNFYIEADEASIEILNEENGDKYLIERFTPENILWHRSRDANGISGLDNYEELFCYDLLYVGIAKIRGIAMNALLKMAIMPD